MCFNEALPKLLVCNGCQTIPHLYTEPNPDGVVECLRCLCGRNVDERSSLDDWHSQSQIGKIVLFYKWNAMIRMT